HRVPSSTRPPHTHTLYPAAPDPLTLTHSTQQPLLQPGACSDRGPLRWERAGWLNGTHAIMLSCMDTCTVAIYRLIPKENKQTNRNTHTHTHTHTQKQTIRNTHTHMHRNRQIETHTQTHTHTHTHTHTYTYTHTHTHTQIHTHRML